MTRYEYATLCDSGDAGVPWGGAVECALLPAARRLGGRCVWCHVERPAAPADGAFCADHSTPAGPHGYGALCRVTETRDDGATTTRSGTWLATWHAFHRESGTADDPDAPLRIPVGAEAARLRVDFVPELLSRPPDCPRCATTPRWAPLRSVRIVELGLRAPPGGQPSAPTAAPVRCG